MPSLEMSKKDLESLCGSQFKTKDELEDALWQAKTELESLEGDEIKASLADTNRPDLLSTEGIARELRYKTGKQKKIQEYKISKGKRIATVDPALEKIRPKAAYAVARNVHITDAFLGQLIQLQEKICLTYGQKRNQIAIGIFDLDQVNGNVRYYAADPNTEFIPLDFTVPMRLSEILAEHPKGKEYGSLLSGLAKYPLLVDSKNQVLSMPPIINSAGSGKVTDKTKNLFLDVTGFDQKKINNALSIFCAALIDRGAKIESVEIRYKNHKTVTPVFEIQKKTFPKKLLEQTTGLEKTDANWKKLFSQSGFAVQFKGKNCLCRYSSLRQDILHAVDIIEDLLISEGFNQIKPDYPKLAVVGHESKESVLLDVVRDACIGLGCQEILTANMTSIEKQTLQIGIQKDEFVQIANPVSTSFEIFRKQLFPELLEFLGKNKHVTYPQKIFEAGSTLSLDPKSETGCAETNRVCIAIAGHDTNFTQIKSHSDALLSYLGHTPQYFETEHPAFEKGKTARIQAGDKTGMLGELNAKTRQNFGLKTPVTILELEI